LVRLYINANIPVVPSTKNGFVIEFKVMKKKEIERLKLKLRAEKDPATVNGSGKQPSVVPRQGPPKVQQPRRRGEI
jgi:hypothetical protein